MVRIAILSAALCLTGLAATAQSMLPRCSAATDGIVSVNGCSCEYDHGGQLTGHAAGWRWQCDLLHGSGYTQAVPPAGPEPEGLPYGFVYAPQVTHGSSSAPIAMGTGRTMRY